MTKLPRVCSRRNEQLKKVCQQYGIDWPLNRPGERYGCDAETVRRALLRQGIQLREIRGRRDPRQRDGQ